MSPVQAKASPTPSKSSSHSDDSICDDDEESEVVEKILGLLCYRIYGMFRFICCFPVASKLYSRSSGMSQTRSHSSHRGTSSVRIIRAGESPPPPQSPKSLQKKILQNLPNSDSRPSLKLSRKSILKNSNIANSKFKISQDISNLNNIKKNRFQFMKFKDFKLKRKEKEVILSTDRKEMVVTYQKDVPNFRSDSTVHTECGDWRNSLKWSKGGSRRPVNFYNDIFEGCPE